MSKTPKIGIKQPREMNSSEKKSKIKEGVSFGKVALTVKSRKISESDSESSESFFN